MPAPIIVCADCREERSHKARGKCSPCYNRWIAHGKPDTVPPATPREKDGLRRLRHRTTVCTDWDGKQRRAALMVASLADGSDDCRHLLDVLGLVEPAEDGAS